MESWFIAGSLLAAFIYLLIAPITLGLIYWSGRASIFTAQLQNGMQEASFWVKISQFFERLMPKFIYSLGVLYFICYSFKIYWWGTWVFFGITIWLIVIKLYIRKIKQLQPNFIDEMGDWKATFIWQLPILIYFVYVYVASMGIFFAYDDMQSIFGTHLPSIQ